MGYRPALCFPCGASPAVAVRFSPQVYKLRPTETTPAIKLAYRMYASYLLGRRPTNQDRSLTSFACLVVRLFAVSYIR